MSSAEVEKKLLGLFMVLPPTNQRTVLGSSIPLAELFELPAAEIAYRSGLKIDYAERLSGFKEWDYVNRLHERMMQSDIAMISMLERRYPYDSNEAIAELPPILFVKGSLSAWSKRGLAVVGTREPTQYGRKVAYSLGSEAASRGIPVVSGMALGIDGEAHNGALDKGGFTIAVMGCGLFNVYPPSHNELFEKICISGVAVSQFLPSQEPDSRFFPSRNQWISFFSDAVVIVEGEHNSGARHTAAYAIKHKRRLYAVPGQIDNSKSHLPNKLLSEGAILLGDISTPFGGGRPVQADIFRGHYSEVHKEEKVSESHSFDVNSLGLSDFALVVFEKIGTGGAGADDLHRALSASLPDLNQALLELELAGIIKQEAGRRYRRT